MFSGVGIAGCAESRASTASNRAASAALTRFLAARISSGVGGRRVTLGGEEDLASSVCKESFK